MMEDFTQREQRTIPTMRQTVTMVVEDPQEAAAIVDGDFLDGRSGEIVCTWAEAQEIIQETYDDAAKIIAQIERRR